MNLVWILIDKQEKKNSIYNLSLLPRSNQHGRNTVPTKRQFTDIYDRKLCKTTVYIIVFDCLNQQRKSLELNE
jgi:hypothetical protein